MKGVDERVNVVKGVVNAHACARGSSDPKVLVKRLGAMVAHTHSNTCIVQDLAHVVGVNTVHHYRGKCQQSVRRLYGA